MSITLHCFEGLNISRCILRCGPEGCCCRGRERRRRQRASENDNSQRVTIVHAIDTNLSGLTIIKAPNRHIVSLSRGHDKQDEAWDYISFDREKRIVMMSGRRFRSFSMIERLKDPSLPADACNGMRIEEVFHSLVANIFNCLVDAGLGNERGGQLHTIYNGTNLTFFEFPMCNERNEIVGVSIIYRPTHYDKEDMSELIRQGMGHTTASVQARHRAVSDAPVSALAAIPMHAGPQSAPGTPPQMAPMGANTSETYVDAAVPL